MATQVLHKTTGAVLATVQGRNLIAAQFAGFNLDSADFRNLDVRDANFTGANLHNATFAGAKTGRAIFTNACLVGTDFTGQDTTVPTNYVLRQVHYEAWTGSRAASTVFRDAAVSSKFLSGAYKQTVTCIRRAQARICVGTREPTAPGAWTVTETNQTCLDDNLGDNHHSLSHGVDGAGFYHLLGPWLDTGFLYFVGSVAGDVNVSASWHSLPVVAGEDALEYNVAYGQIVDNPTRLGNDLLYSFWAIGGGPSAYANAGIIWRKIDGTTRAHTTLTTGPGLIKSGFCPYKTQAVFDSTGKLWLAGCYRDDATIQSNHDVWCCWSDPADGAIASKWRSAKTGNLVTQPVQTTDSDNMVVVSQSTNSGMMNSFGLALPSDLPCVAYWSGNPCNYYLANKRATGGAWVNRQVGTLGISYTLVNMLDANIGVLPLTQPRCLATAGGDLWILFTTPGGSAGIWGYKITAAELDSTSSLASKSPTLLCPYDVGGSATPFDELLYRETGKLHMFCQRCDAADTTDLGTGIPVFIAELVLP